MRRSVVALALLLGACKSAPVPSTFGINVTIDARSIPAAARSQIVSASLAVTGDETYNRTFDIHAAVATGEVRFRYIPGIQSGTVNLGLNALSGDGTIVATAPAVSVDVTAGHAVAATLVLGGPEMDDMGTSMGDGGGNVCEPGSHECAGTCVDDRSVDNCATSCSACPVTANASGATCDGTSCGLSCNSGFHVCNGACVSSTSSDSCNMSCTPCTPPTGGTATCDGTSCNGSCPGGQKLCFGMCIPNGMACNGSCPNGTHECSGNCFDNTSVNSCGTSCMPCPVPPNATMATCTGSTCGFVCNSGYKQCGSTCIPSTGCCMNGDCAQPSNGVATCDTASNTCIVACNSNYTKCGMQCIPTTACCINADCPQPSNGAGTCNSSHMCTASCNAPYNMVCGSACVDTTSDNNNCGGCGVVCGGGGQCGLSRCVTVLASSQFSPVQLAVDANNVYWANGGDILGTTGSVMKVSTSGGTAVPLATSQPMPGYIATDATSIYWDAHGMFGAGGLRKIAKTGGGVTDLVTSQFTLGGIAVDGTNAYFTNIGFMTTMGNVNQVPVGGGTALQLATGKNCGSLAVSSSIVYWTDGNGALLKTPVGGGTSVQIATGSITYVTTDGTRLYWSDGGTGTDGDIKMMTIGGSSATPLATGLKYPRLPITDGTSVYWITGDSAIMKVATSGGAATLVNSGPAVHIAVDATSIYWTSGGSSAMTGTVVKATPK